MSDSSFRCAYLLGESRLEIRRLPVPTPGDGELAVEIDVATTCGTDLKVYRRGGHPRMLTPPCPFGHEMAATVAEVGSGVTRWKAGDRVVIANSAPCNSCAACRAGRENLCEDLQYLNGAFAERLLVPARFANRSVHHLPQGVPAAVGSLAEPLACVVHGLDRMHLAQECDVLVIGGGPIGLMFVYLLARYGHRVTLADPHRSRLDLAGRLGAAATHQIADRERLGEELEGSATSESDFNAAVEATGSPAAWRAAIDTVKAGGVVNLFGGCAPGTEVTLDTHRAHYHELTLLGSYHHRPETFARALELLAEPQHPLAELVSFDCSLETLERALQQMAERRAFKVAVHPRSQ